MTEENRAEIAAAEDQQQTVENEPHPGFKDIFRQAFDKAQQQNRPKSRSGLGRDHSRSLILLGGAAIAVLLLFLTVFSSSNHQGKSANTRARGVPDLGQRSTPGQQGSGQAGSAIPLMSAQTTNSESGDTKQITATDVNNTARPIQPTTSSPPQVNTSLPARPNRPYALSNIDVSDLQAHQQPTQTDLTAKQESDDLRKPSLVFVRATQSASVGSSPRSLGSSFDEEARQIQLPAGTRLVARLQSVVTSAMKTPVVAVIEYNYERDGEIVVPAGAKALGTLQQADRSGNVGFRFTSIQMPDGTTEKIDATSMSLSYGLLKGSVSGKKTGTNFLVRTFTGLGEAATYLVGSGGLSAPLSESAFLRDRIATNIGIAGDQELNTLSSSQNIVVTVPGNTQFYLVMEQGSLLPDSNELPNGARTAAAQQPSNPPTLEELRELLQLRQEMSAMYQPTGNTQVAAQPAPQQ
jgi:hypothetical protein